MDFGLGLLSYPNCWADAAFAEEHGFTTAGFADSPLLGGDAFICLALAAAETTRLRLGTFLAVPSNRSAATTAAAISTVNRIAPGRVFLGVGTGNTSRATFGLRPLGSATLTRFAADCRTLLAGREVAGPDAPPYRLAFAYDADFDPALDADIPIYVAADGPKALRVAGEVGDGWVTTMQFSHVMETSSGVFAESRSRIRQAGAAVGRPTEQYYTMLSAGLCVLDDGESATSPRALEMAGPVAMLPFHAYADNSAVADHLPPVVQARLPVYEREVLARFPAGPGQRHQWTHRGHLSHLLPGEAGVLTDDLMRQTTLTGTAEQIAGTVSALESVGLSNVTVWIPPRLTRTGVRDIQHRLMPALAGLTVAAGTGARA